MIVFIDFMSVVMLAMVMCGFAICATRRFTPRRNRVSNPFVEHRPPRWICENASSKHQQSEGPS
jgi:hypothetical protein